MKIYSDNCTLSGTTNIRAVLRGENIQYLVTNRWKQVETGGNRWKQVETGGNIYTIHDSFIPTGGITVQITLEHFHEERNLWRNLN